MHKFWLHYATVHNHIKHLQYGIQNKNSYFLLINSMKSQFYLYNVFIVLTLSLVKNSCTDAKIPSAETTGSLCNPSSNPQYRKLSKMLQFWYFDVFEETIQYESR